MPGHSQGFTYPGSFFYFRLSVFPITLPSLRERKSDIPALVGHFIQKKCREIGLRSYPSLGPGMIDQLMAYDWPGNVRELENAVERAIILSRGKDHLVFGDIPSSGFWGPEDANEAGDEALPLREVEAKHIRRMLAKTRGRINGREGAAELLGINSGALRHRMRKLGIPFGRKASL